ncbi:hypothetical protein MMC30_004538 [Trapelia coarctata]|nr:hypothetical protein [Trapelia coarctata]
MEQAERGEDGASGLWRREPSPRGRWRLVDIGEACRYSKTERGGKRRRRQRRGLGLVDGMANREKKKEAEKKRVAALADAEYLAEQPRFRPEEEYEVGYDEVVEAADEYEEGDDEENELFDDGVSGLVGMEGGGEEMNAGEAGEEGGGMDVDEEIVAEDMDGGAGAIG